MTGLVITLLRFINIAFEVYFIILLIRVVLSWVRMSPYSKFYQFIFNMTEPLLAPIRKRTVSPNMPVDFSPMILMLVLIVVERLIAVLVTLLL